MSSEAYMRRARKKYIRPLAKGRFCNVCDGFLVMPERRVRAMIRAAESCNTGNCWFAEYRVAQYVLPSLRARLAAIESRKRGGK